MSLLSLVMIVRDAAELLPGFFSHHEGLWDEAVVVDTGSSDGTVELARRAGAHVLEQSWQDDFSAPRNAGLEIAQGERILLLDADERIAQCDFAAVRAAAAGAPCAWLQETVNYCAERSHLEWRPVRGRYPLEESRQLGYFAARRVGVFPRQAEIRFRGRIHESVLADCERAGLPLRELRVPVHHYGYVSSPKIDARRRALYFSLAERKLADEPGDWSARLELATAMLEAGRVAEAEAALERAAAGPGELRPVARARFLLGRLRREQGHADQAEALLAAAVRDDPTFLFGWLEWLRLLAAAERWRDVFLTVARARQACGADEPLIDREELMALVRTARLPEALALARRLAADCPRWLEIAALRDRLERMVGDEDSGPGPSRNGAR